MYSATINENEIRLLRRKLSSYKPSVRNLCNKAIELFRKAVEVNPSYALAHFNLARSVAIIGDKVEAAKLYQMAQDINKITQEIDPRDIADKISELFES